METPHQHQSVRTARRSIRDVRTAAGMPGVSAERHKAYMRVGSLELERARNERQRDAALQQAATCQRRCEALQTQINAILGGLELREPKPDPKRSGSEESLRIRY